MVPTGRVTDPTDEQGGTTSELDGTRRRSFDHVGIRPSAGEHRERTTIRRRELGAGNGKRSRVGADRSSRRPPTESERIGDRRDKLITRIPASGQIHRQTNCVAVSLPPATGTRSRHGGRYTRSAERAQGRKAYQIVMKVRAGPGDRSSPPHPRIQRSERPPAIGCPCDTRPPSARPRRCRG
jgi:hypothetical protein